MLPQPLFLLIVSLYLPVQAPSVAPLTHTTMVSELVSATQVTISPSKDVYKDSHALPTAFVKPMAHANAMLALPTITDSVQDVLQVPFGAHNLTLAFLSVDKTPFTAMLQVPASAIQDTVSKTANVKSVLIITSSATDTV